MKIIENNKKPPEYFTDKYIGVVLTCPECKSKLEWEKDDYLRIIKTVPHDWYERNISRDLGNMYISCPCCGERISLIIQNGGGYYGSGKETNYFEKAIKENEREKKNNT